jgi:hypothetical protein
LEKKRNMKEKREMIVKEETNDVKASAASYIYLGSKVKLTEITTANVLGVKPGTAVRANPGS